MDLPLLILACILNPSETEWNFESRWDLVAAWDPCVWNWCTKKDWEPNPSNGLHMRQAHFGMFFESVGVSVILCSTTCSNGIQTFIRMKSRHKTKLSANALDVFGMRPTSLRHEFRIRSSRCETLRNDGFQRNHNILAYEIEAWNENECQTTWMDLVCALPHFRMHFEFIRVGKKLSSTWVGTGTTHWCIRNRATNWNLVPNASNGLHMQPCSLWHTLCIRPC